VPGFAQHVPKHHRRSLEREILQAEALDAFVDLGIGRARACEA
jgi:hypothetical protein